MIDHDTKIPTWGHTTSCPGGQVHLSWAGLDGSLSERDGVTLSVEQDTWGKKSTANGFLPVVHLNAESLPGLISALQDRLDDLRARGKTTTKEEVAPVTTETPTQFSTVVQDKVWKHLTSADGDTKLRLEALGLLSASRFFSPLQYGTRAGRETDAVTNLKSLLKSRDFEKFCASGKERLLAAVEPPKPKVQHELVIEVRVPIKEGRLAHGEYNPKIDRFGSGGSISEYVARDLRETLRGQRVIVGDSHFQIDGEITVTGKGCEIRK